MTPTIFQNIEFFVLLALAIGLVLLCGRLSGILHKLALIAASVFFILALPGIQWPYIQFMAAFIAAIWLVGRILLSQLWQSWSGAARGVSAAMVATLLVFCLIKFPTFGALFASPLDSNVTLTSLVPIFGFSFFGLKAYSFFADISAGRIKKLNELNLLIYFLYFPTFLSGPITRYPQFSKAVDEAGQTELSWDVARQQAPRFVLGLLKTFVLVGLLSPHAIPFLSERQLADPMTIYIGLIAYYWYEYMNFSGYSDLAITTSKAMNIDVPENFNKPFLATSLTDLWRRWHISLAHWLRDYIYYPLLFRLMSTFNPKGQFTRAGLSSVSIFSTFTICGLWHGEALGMILFGVLSGIVLGIEVMLTQVVWPKVKDVVEGDGWLRLGFSNLSRIFTFHVAILTFGPVLMETDKIFIAINTLFWF
jgi:D-alanyl-lipoteichoic acid acyltransferase DltB (MBOAT superfamily)